MSYADIPGFPGYRVSTDGRVQSRRGRGVQAFAREWRDLSPGVDAKGYLGVTLCNATCHKPIRIHRLVAIAFIPNPNNKPCVRHLNGNPADNRVENLAWGTYRENEDDKRRHGTWLRAPNGKLTDRQRAEIRRRYVAGESQAALALEHGASRPTITRLINGSTWKEHDRHADLGRV